MKAHSENEVQSLVFHPDAQAGRGDGLDLMQPDAESDGSIATVAATPVAPGVGVPWRVLVVEDDPLIGEDIACTLDECGFSVVGRVQTLGDALRFVQDRSGQLDCVVLDIDLGGQSCQPLVASLETHKVPYALVTAHSPDVVHELGFRAPVIEKPFKTADLSMQLSGLFSQERQEA